MSSLDWFNQARYGLFVHWGPYSAAGRGEWVMNRERIPVPEYREQYASRFTAEHYDPASWAKMARRWGMKYVVLTTRHHDGYCLWDTKTTPWNSAKLGAKRDLVGPFVEAVRAEGLKVGLYYSVADWSHPDYPGAFQRDWPKSWPDEAARLRFVAFYHAQLEELMTRYGPVDMLWYDGCIPRPTDGEAINRRVKELQPGILINERNGEPCDFHCSEQSLKAKDGAWEACMTLNRNWGYHAGDHDWKNPREVVSMLLTTCKSAGNLLLNIGPMGDGRIPEESVRILDRVGLWLDRWGAFLPGSDRSPFTWNNSVVLTTRGESVFVHLMYATESKLCVAEIANKVVSARWLDSGEPVRFEQKGERLWLLDLPTTMPDELGACIELKVEGKPAPITEQGTFWIPD